MWKRVLRRVLLGIAVLSALSAFLIGETQWQLPLPGAHPVPADARR